MYLGEGFWSYGPPGGKNPKIKKKMIFYTKTGQDMVLITHLTWEKHVYGVTGNLGAKIKKSKKK